MRAIMARLRGPRMTPGDRVDAALARGCSLEGCPDTRPHYHRGDDELVRLPGVNGLPLNEWVDRAKAAAAAQELVVSTGVPEAFDQCVKLGLDPDPAAEYDVPELIRYAYKEGWLACEARLTARNMADAIDLAINTPASVVEQLPGESFNRWTIRAVQNAVAYGVTSEREATG